jgi:hypothetical protein
MPVGLLVVLAERKAQALKAAITVPFLQSVLDPKCFKIK